MSSDFSDTLDLSVGTVKAIFYVLPPLFELLISRVHRKKYGRKFKESRIGWLICFARLTWNLIKMTLENDTAIIHPSKLQSTIIRVSGYKHAATLIIAASLITPTLVTHLSNLPNIDDVTFLIKIIQALGGSCDYSSNERTLIINSEGLCNYQVPEEYSQHIHGSIYFLPVLLGRFKKVTLGNCGGCPIGVDSALGKRPIEHMISVLEKFGANVQVKFGTVSASITNFIAATIDIQDYSDRPDILTGPCISGATKTAILAAAFVKQGTTKILNPYLKSDVIELLEYLKNVGYLIEYNENMITLSSRTTIEKRIVKHHLMSDISQIMTWLSVAIYHHIPLTLTHVTVNKAQEGLKSELEYLRHMGVEITFNRDSLFLMRPSIIQQINIDVFSTSIYSDHQPFFALMLLTATGKSLIREHVWQLRFNYAKELLKLGLLLQIDKNILEITPSKPRFQNKKLHAQDLRGAAVLIIAALGAPGINQVKGIHHLNRGYEYFIHELIFMGAEIDVI